MFMIFVFFCETTLKMQEIAFQNLIKAKNFPGRMPLDPLYRWVVPPPTISWFLRLCLTERRVSFQNIPIYRTIQMI